MAAAAAACGGVEMSKMTTMMELLLSTEQVARWERQTERRQLFLRSYHFSRHPTTLAGRARRALVRARRLVWARLRCLPRLLRSFPRPRRGARFHRLVVHRRPPTAAASAAPNWFC
ncbi:uncharacterized protein LOC109719135 [Ananas comosus]|uniref:Uncharacterized protein LOC109719135 n=1 Tax=Ananas comosus TaxID=4615 RepID=A0A6P5G099_ANACO|nr:uncharacterized protein LOC109719135 [Ananas comosus]